VHQIRAVTKVDYGRGQGLFRRYTCRGVAPHALLRSHRLVEGLTQANAHILHRVVIVDIEVPRGMYFQIIKPMPRDHAEHMIEKRNPRMESVDTATIQVERHPDVRFGGTAVNAATAFHDNPSSR